MTQPQCIALYIYKRANPDVILRIPEPTEKIHGWVVTHIEVLQRLNDNPMVFHWKQVTLPFKGELILSLLPDFNRILRTEIEEAIPRKTPALVRWLQQDIEDVVLIRSRRAESFGFEHELMEVTTIYRTRYKNYFEMRSWRSSQWQKLLEIAETEKMERNNSYGTLLDEIDAFIGSFEVVRESKYEDMFKLHRKPKQPKERPKDRYQLQYENAVMMKYRLPEYLQE